MKIQLAADSARFVLTLTTDPGNAWRYNLPKPATTPGTRGWRSEGSSLRTTAPPFRQITVVPGQGYEPGTVETWPIRHDAGRTPAHSELDVTYPAR